MIVGAILRSILWPVDGGSRRAGRPGIAIGIDGCAMMRWCGHDCWCHPWKPIVVSRR